MKAAEQMKPHVEMLALELIDDEANPRKAVGDITELTESVREKGVLQPVLVRPVDERYQLVFGRRRLAAARAAKLDLVPAMIREMSDAEMLEAQIIENLQRKDIHPLEEAEALQQLRDKHGHAVEDIAAKIGKSVGYVLGRLRFCGLAPAAKRLFLAGDLTAAHAVLVARIPVKALQEQAAQEIVGKGDDEPMTAREAAGHIERGFMLRLSEAQFKIDDAELVPGAGPCTTCLKRTGNQRELFSDIKSPDICVDPSCFQSKQTALWQLKVKKAKEVQQPVIPDRDSKKLFRFGGRFEDSSLVDIDAESYDTGYKPPRKVLPKDVQTTLVRNPETGRIHELVERSVVQKAAKKAAPAKSPSADPKDAERKKKLELRKKVVELAIDLLVTAARKKSDEVVLELLTNEIGITEAKALERVSEAFGVPFGSPPTHPDDIAAMLYLLQVVPNAAGSTWSSNYNPGFETACELLGIDLKRLEGEAKKEKAEKKVAEPGRACIVPGCINASHGRLTKNHGVFWCSIHANLPAAERIAFVKGAAAPAPKKGNKK